MKLSNVSIKRPVFTTMIMLFLFVIGMIGFRDIGVDLFPKVEFPIISLVSQLPGANPEAVETLVSEPIEEALSSISSIKNLRSISGDTVSQVIIEFDLEKKIDIAYQEVQAKLATIRSDLPQDLEDPVIEKFDIDSAPIMSVVVSGKLPLPEISNIADKIIKTRLQQIKDVGQITLIGKRERTIWIHVNPQKLEGFKLSVDDVINALKSHHVEFPGGRMNANGDEIQVKTKAEFTSIDELRGMCIYYQGGFPIRLSDVAKVEDGLEEERTLSRLNSDKAVSLLIRKQSGTNTCEVAKALKLEISKLKHEFGPQSVTIEIAQDLSLYIEESIHEIEFHLIFGGLLAVFIVLIFLRNVRITLISALAIPLSVITTFALMHAMGFTLNTMTMLALSLAIGILIDDAIVVVENIHRHFKTKKNAEEAARTGSEEIGLAAFAITMSIVAVFLPVAFMKGIIGRFFFQFGLTVTFSVLVSLFIAFTVIPMLAAKFLKHKEKEMWLSRVLESLFKKLEELYSFFLRGALRFRKTTLLIALLGFISSLSLTKYIRSEFTPIEDQSEFSIKVKAPLGSTVEKTDSYLQQIVKAIKLKPWVEYTFSTVGGDALEKVNEGAIYVKMVDKLQRSLSQIDAMREVRTELSRLSSIKTSVEQVPRVSGGGRKATAIILQIKGPDMSKVEEISQKVKAHISSLGGYVDLDSSYETGKPELEVSMKRDKLTALGVTPFTIGATIKTLVGGKAVSKFKEKGERYDITVRLDEPFRKEVESILPLTVRANSGNLIPLRNLVEVKKTHGPVQIERLNRSKIITIYANLQDGKILGDAIQEIQTYFEELKLAPGYSFSFSGSAEAMKDSFQHLLFALLLSVLAVYMVLASQFESFIHPFTIMLSIPFSLVGALGCLATTNSTFSIFTIIGIIMLFGLVTKNGILLVDYTNTLRKRNLSKKDALLQAGRARLSPILMTTLAMIFGMLPIALGHGAGSESRAPMAIAVIGGLATSMFLTLIIIPVVYSLLDDLAERFRRKSISHEPTEFEAVN